MHTKYLENVRNKIDSVFQYCLWKENTSIFSFYSNPMVDKVALTKRSQIFIKSFLLFIELYIMYESWVIKCEVLVASGLNTLTAITTYNSSRLATTLRITCINILFSTPISGNSATSPAVVQPAQFHWALRNSHWVSREWHTLRDARGTSAVETLHQTGRSSCRTCRCLRWRIDDDWSLGTRRRSRIRKGKGLEWTSISAAVLGWRIRSLRDTSFVRRRRGGVEARAIPSLGWNPCRTNHWVCKAWNGR